MTDELPTYFELILDQEGDRQRPVTRVFRHVLLIAKCYQRVIADVAARHQLQAGDFLVLMTLARAGAAPVRPTELYRSLLVTSGAISKRLERLERAGLVSRKAGGEDKRSSPVLLTAQGRSIANEVRAERNGLHDIAEWFGMARLEQLDQLLLGYIAAARRAGVIEEP